MCPDCRLDLVKILALDAPFVGAVTYGVVRDGVDWLMISLVVIVTIAMCVELELWDRRRCHPDRDDEAKRA